MNTVLKISLGYFSLLVLFLALPAHAQKVIHIDQYPSHISPYDFPEDGPQLKKKPHLRRSCEANDFVESLQDSIDIAVTGVLPENKKSCRWEPKTGDLLLNDLQLNPLNAQLALDPRLDEKIRASGLPERINAGFARQQKHMHDNFVVEHDHWQACEKAYAARKKKAQHHRPLLAFFDENEAGVNEKALMSNQAPEEPKKGDQFHDHYKDEEVEYDPCPDQPEDDSLYATEEPGWSAYRGVLSLKAPLKRTFLEFLFQEPSGGGDSYTYSVVEHVNRVLKIYSEQSHPYLVQQIPLQSNTGRPLQIADNDRLMRYTLALHDIGKSIAYRAGDKIYETLYSVPIAEEVLQDVTLPDGSRFSADEVLLAANLIAGHQLIGDYLRHYTSLQKTVTYINQEIHDSQVNPCGYYLLLELLFVADAGSYDFLQHDVFDRGNKVVDGISPLVVRNHDFYAQLSDLYRHTCPESFRETPKPPPVFKLDPKIFTDPFGNSQPPRKHFPKEAEPGADQNSSLI